MKAGHRLAGVVMLAGAMALASQAFAQGLSAKPLRALVPFPPGGSVDVLTRALATQITASTGQPVLVENRPGGATMLAMAACAKAPPDGFTVCVSTPDGVVYAPHLYTTVPYDAERDFAGVTNLIFSSSALYVSSASPYKTFPELIAAAKAKPGSINFATWGAGSIPDIVLRYINNQLGVNIVAIPYKGAQPSLAGVLAGEIHATYFGIGPLLAQARAGKVRMLVVAGSKRSPFAPDLPTLGDFGADGGMPSYFGVWTAAQTPTPMINALNAEFVKALHTPAIAKVLTNLTIEAVGNSPAEFDKFIIAERANAGRLLKSLGVKPLDAPN